MKDQALTKLFAVASDLVLSAQHDFNLALETTSWNEAVGCTIDTIAKLEGAIALLKSAQLINRA